MLVVESVTGGKIIDYVVQVQFEVKEGNALPPNPRDTAPGAIPRGLSD